MELSEALTSAVNEKKMDNVDDVKDDYIVLTNDENKEIRGVKVSKLQPINYIYFNSTIKFCAGYRYDDEFISEITNTDLPFYRKDYIPCIGFVNFIQFKYNSESEEVEVDRRVARIDINRVKYNRNADDNLTYDYRIVFTIYATGVGGAFTTNVFYDTETNTAWEN